MRPWLGPLALGLAVMVVASVGDVAGARDFRAFVMTIEYWNAEAIGLSDGTRLPRTDVYTLEYWNRRNWTMTRIDDPDRRDRFVEGRRCRAGQYYYYDQGGWQWSSDDPGFCNGVGRWIHWGIAWSYQWVREAGPEPGQVTYTDPGERVVFDLRTGLPLVYEAGLTTGAVKERESYRLERFLD